MKRVGHRAETYNALLVVEFGGLPLDVKCVIRALNKKLDKQVRFVYLTIQSHIDCDCPFFRRMS